MRTRIVIKSRYTRERKEISRSQAKTGWNVFAAARDVVRYPETVLATGRKKRSSSSTSPTFYPARQPENSRATHRARVSPTSRGDRNVPDRLHGIDSSPANSRRARRREVERKKVGGDTETRTADFMLNGLDSGMRALDGLPSPCHPLAKPAPPSSSCPTGPRRSQNRIVRGSCTLSPAPVALIASSNSGLIDEFRRRAARK